MSPSFRALLFPSVSAPTQSFAEAAHFPSSSSSFFVVGFKEYFGSGPPLGRPECEASTRRAPFSIASFSVGSVSRIRVSSVTTPSFSGTLKSTRRNTRLPRRSRSLIVSLAIIRNPQRNLKFCGHEFNQVAAAAGIAPFVVIPRQHFHAAVPNYFRVSGIHNGRIPISL